MITIALPYFHDEATWHQLELIPEADIQKSYHESIRDLETTEQVIAAQGYRSKRANCWLRFMGGLRRGSTRAI